MSRYVQPPYDPDLDDIPDDEEWNPGDPCAACGSTDTGWDIVDGAVCNSCGRTDADE